MSKCDFPFYVDNPRPYVVGVPYTPRVPVPCGRCATCISRRVQTWSARLQIEERQHATAYFVGLDFAHAPLSEKGRMTLLVKPLQLFFKRLRKLSPSPVKYYAVGEYGGSYKMRPHYHAIIFGADVEHIRQAWEDYNDGDRQPAPSRRSKNPPQKIPEREYYVTGHVHIGHVTGASIAYTLKYITKKGRVPQYEGDDRLPEFSISSKHLGDAYLSPPNIKKHAADISRSFMLREGGIKVPLPRHWREKLYTVEQRDKQAAAIYQRVQDDEAKRQEDYRVRTGSLHGYEESINQAKIDSMQKVRYSASKRKEH